MDSVDDSTVATPSETSNLSTPESSSSEVSQPTVKLRVNEPKYRKVQKDGVKRGSSAEGRQQFLLDKDGCQLVETTGRTAQRARATIRDSARFNQKSSHPEDAAGTNVADRSWPSSWLQLRKSRSTTSVGTQDRKPNRRLRKRHSYGVESSRRSWDKPEVNETPKRYSAGDYLRQQILEDLSSNEIIGKTEEQIAEDRCNRVKAYLRRRQEDSPYVPPEARLKELKSCWQSEGRCADDSRTAGLAHRQNDLDRVRAYLQEKIRSKMNEEEEWRSRENQKPSVDYPNELTMHDIRKRYSDHCGTANRDGHPNRRVRNDEIFGLETLSSESGQDDGKLVRSSYSHGNRYPTRGNCCRRTRSEVIPETVIDPEDNEVRKRFYSYSAGRRNSWKTKSGLTFEKKLSLPSGSSVDRKRESEITAPVCRRNDRQYTTNTNERDFEAGFKRNGRKYCRRTRSDTLSEKCMQPTSGSRRAKRRSVSWSDKRKLHRRTSDKLAEFTGDTSVDSERDTAGLARRTKYQQANYLCSWREYKEKRRQDRMRKALASAAGDEISTNICTTPKAWTSLQELTPSAGGNTDEVRNYGCTNRETNLVANEWSAEHGTTTKPNRTNENSVECARNTGETPDDTETETILQENYLLLEIDGNERDAGLRSPTISKLQVNEYRDDNDSLTYEFGAADMGYDTIPKHRRGPAAEIGGWIEFNANSNVKKSDTFKIVDGSEGAIDDQCQKRMGMRDSCAIATPRTSSDSKSSSLGRANVRTGDEAAEADGFETFDSRQSELDDSKTHVSNAQATSEAVARSNKDIARDYFSRVYELLKQRQEETRRETVEVLAPTGHEADTSSSNCAKHEEVRKRRRRRKKDDAYQGEELVNVSPVVDGDDDWTVQRLLVNNEPSNLIFRRPQLQNVTGQKRPRHPAPPIPANCKINAKDISKYFDYPNKENSPRNGLNENKRSERNESIEEEQQQQQQQSAEENDNEMGSNLSRHNGKGLTGRRTQSSGNLSDPKGKLNHVGKILVPCSSSQRESRYKICGSLPNHLDDKEILEDEDTRENNNVISDTMVGNLGGTLPHKKRALGVHFSDTGPTGTLDLVKHRSQDSLEGDPWRYQDGADLDLVRCKHGNFDLVRKNQSVDVVDGDASGKRYGTIGRSSNSKCHRGADLDLVGALPKRRTDESKGAVLRQSFEARQNRSIERLDGDLLIKVMHKPDCELMKHRQFDRAVDLKLSRLVGGEPQDQGYASERSPEDEHPPSLPGQPFPNVTPESTFRVTLQKSSRGLGLSVSGGGTAGPVRVKRLFPQQPAALSNKLQPGDILLAANGVPLTGLTNYEALEVLRTTPSTVELVVCRLPGDTSITPPGAPPPPPARREPPPPPLRILNPLPPLQIEPCGEFDIEMTKVAGSLGFTLRKVDSSALGHYVRALVREPALSDGRIQPGDKIVAVDGATLSPMSHEEAVALLRQCGPRVKLRLYRDLAQTPVSALSPTEPDHPLRPPRTSLRQEAVDMLCDLAVRKLSPGTSNGSNSRQTSAASCHSPRRLRKPLSRTPTADNDQENHLTFHPVHPTSHAEVSDTDQCSINTMATNSQTETPSNDIIDPPPLYDVCDSSDSSKIASRPSFLDLSAPPEKPHFQFSLESDSDYTGPIIVTESDSNLTAECDYDDRAKDEQIRSNDVQDSDLPTEPASMPPLLSATRTTSGVFSYKNPAYQSANPTCGGIDNSAKNKAAHSSDQDIPGKVLGAEDPAGSKGLLKWKGVMFAPNDRVDETNGNTETEEAKNESTAESATRHETSEDGNEVFMVELTRGWNSRLGFSLQPEGNSTVISVVHPDSVAAKDGRLKQGDVLIMVNDESVENMPTAEIIDLLRKIRGSIGITVMRTNKKNPLS